MLCFVRGGQTDAGKVDQSCVRDRPTDEACASVVAVVTNRGQGPGHDGGSGGDT